MASKDKSDIEAARELIEHARRLPLASAAGAGSGHSSLFKALFLLAKHAHEPYDFTALRAKLDQQHEHIRKLQGRVDELERKERAES